MPKTRQPTLLLALLPIAVLVVLLTANVIFFGSDATAGPNQIALVMAAAVAGIISWQLGFGWKDIEHSVVKSIGTAMGAMLILLVIGSLAGTWLISGIVPAMIYYGLQVLNPTIFLFASCIVCSVVALATGSSWSTIATVGIALLGIGKALGMHEGWIAGAIISGAYFGDKMSPLSDTTNLAPAMVGTDLFTHIRFMVYTTVPVLAITLTIYLFRGVLQEAPEAEADSAAVLAAIDQSFDLNPILFVVPVLVLLMIVRKVPAIPALLAGTVLGAVAAVIFQPQIINQVSGIEGNYLQSAGITVMRAMSGSVKIATNDAMISELLSSDGMAGMLNTIWLIICAMVFGGVMESCGLLKTIAGHIIRLAHSTGSLVASTAATCIFFNLTASDQYMAIAVPGRMFSETYRKRGLQPELLSRTLEDSGTVTSVLIPWNTCGATQSGVLGVSTWVYAPFCFFCLLSPAMTVLQAYMMFKIVKADAPAETNP